MVDVRAYENATPPTAAANDSDPIVTGLEFMLLEDGFLKAIHWWQATTGASNANRTVALYSTTDGVTGTLIAGTTKTQAPSGPGWQTVTLDAPVALTANTRYRACVLHPAGAYVATARYFTGEGAGYGGSVEGGVTHDDVLFVPNTAAAHGEDQMSFASGSVMAFPVTSFEGANYWNDVTVDVDGGGGPDPDPDPEPTTSVYYRLLAEGWTPCEVVQF